MNKLSTLMCIAGLGEFMSGIQVHHAKLYFAGSAGNWKNSLPMIRPALDSVGKTVGAQNPEFNVIKIPDTPPITNQVFTK